MKRAVFMIFLLTTLALHGANRRYWATVYEPFDSIADLCDLSRNSPVVPPPELDSWIRQMDNMAEKRDDDRLRARVMFWEAWRDICVARPHDALKKTIKALAMVDSLKYPYDFHRLKWYRTLCSEQGNLVTIYRVARRELDYYTSIGDDQMTAVMLFNIGRSYAYIMDFEKALEYYERGIDLYRKLGLAHSILVVEQSILAFYAQAGNTKRAREIYEKALRTNALQRDTAGMIVVYTNGKVAGIAPDGAKKAYMLAGKWGRMNEICYTSVNYGRQLMEDGRPEEALKLFRYVVEDYRSYTDDYYKFYTAALLGASQCYGQCGRPDSAYVWWQRYKALSDSIFNLNRSDRYQELYDELSATVEAERLETLRREAHTQTATALLLGILLLAGASVGIWSMHIRQRIRKAETIRLTARMELEQTEHQLYRERAQKSEERLLENSTLLQEKRTMISNLGSRIEQHGQDGTISPKARRELLNFIRIHQGTEESLIKFYDYFNHVHPEFFQRLKEQFPSLTKGDLRLCAYLRTGLDTSQAAQLLSVQPSAVFAARYRLRAKLGLPTAASLDDFLRTL